MVILPVIIVNSHNTSLRLHSHFFTLVPDFIVTHLQFIANLSPYLQFLHFLIQSADISQINHPGPQLCSFPRAPSFTDSPLSTNKSKTSQIEIKGPLVPNLLPTSFPITHLHISNPSSKRGCLTFSIHYRAFGTRVPGSRGLPAPDPGWFRS